MKKKIVMALMVGAMVGVMMSGCGKKADTAETVDTEATVEDTEATDSATDESVDESANETTDADTNESDETEDVDADETESQDVVDESAYLDAGFPEDPLEAVKIIKSMKDYDVRIEYTMKANDYYYNTNDDDVVATWADAIYPYFDAILGSEDLTD